jgi:hypothetical protein
MVLSSKKRERERETGKRKPERKSPILLHIYRDKK